MGSLGSNTSRTTQRPRAHKSEIILPTSFSFSLIHADQVVSLTNMQGEDESVFWTSEQRLVCFEPELRKILDLPRRARLPRVLLPGFVAFHEIDRTGKAGSCPARVQIDAGNSANFAIEREFLPIVSEWAAYVTLEKGLEFHLTTQISSQPQSVHPTLKDLLNREIFLLTEGAEHFTVPAGVFRNSLTSAKQEDHINRYGRSNRAVAFTAPDLLTNFEAVLEAHNVSKDYDVHKLPLMRAIEELFGRGDLDCPSIIINPCDGKRELALPGHVGLQWLKDA